MRVGSEPDLARDLYAFRTCFHARERDTFAEVELLDAVEAPQKIEMPPRAAELSGRAGLQTDFGLFGDDAVDLAVFHRAQRRPVDLACRELRASLLERSRPEQAADMIGTKWRLGGHLHSLCVGVRS